MVVTCGEFPDALPETQDSLTLILSGSTRNPKARMRNASLSANFLADYIAAIAPSDDNEQDGFTSREHLRDAVSFIANELLENALKFHHDPERQMSLTLGLGPSSALFVLINTVDPARVEALSTRFSELLSKDPGELYVERVERSAAAGNNVSSGLGLLTMLNDYGARLAWRMESPPGDAVVTLTTLVQILI